MSTNSGIEWTDATWNPTTGCTRVSSGCDHCYAVRMTHRLAAMQYAQNTSLTTYKGLTAVNGKGEWHFNGVVRCLPDRLSDPLHWRKPKMIFANSMSDLFHKDVPFEFIDQVFAVMALCPQHTFQILTKRPERMAEYLAVRDWGEVIADARFGYLHHQSSGVMSTLAEAYQSEDGLAHADTQWLREEFAKQGGRKLPQAWPFTNVWLGTSIEDQATADERIPHLLECPAAVRFLSVEPMLRPVDLRQISDPRDEANTLYFPLVGEATCEGLNEPISGPHIHWVIVGGESGPGARPMHPDWVRSIRDQCQAAAVPFFFKQWGEWLPDECMFKDHQHWVNKASTWVERGTCLDACGKRLCNGADFQTAVFPVAIVRRVGKNTAGAMLDGREWREYPK